MEFMSFTSNLHLYRDYTADVKTEPVSDDYDYTLEELPHTYSNPFNPYKQSRYYTHTHMHTVWNLGIF